MKKTVAFMLLILLVIAVCAACATASPGTATPGTLPPAVSSPAGMPARPGSNATGDPSANLGELVEVSGTVKRAQEGLVLITTSEGGEFMLRFSENSKWSDGVSQDIREGNTITCRVKPEPTFTMPSQGEVFLVIQNAAK